MSVLNSYENILWDWNGTLLNDVNLCVTIVNEFLEHQNKTILKKELYKSIFDFPIINYYKAAGLEFQDESFDDLTKKFIHKYNSNVLNQSLQNDAVNVLDFCKNKNQNQFILTAAFEKDVHQFTTKFQISHYFKKIKGLTNYKAESKVLIGQNLVETENINRKATVLIGDTTHDFEVAQQLNVDCILIADGHQSREKLQQSTKSNTLILNSLKELINV